MLSTMKSSAVLFVTVCLLAASGCQTTTEEMPEKTIVLAEPVTILYKMVGGDPALKDPGLSLITSQAQLDALGVDALLGREVDFANEDVLLATLGELPSGGHWINITDVHLEGDELHVYGRANRPHPDDAVGQFFTYPFCAVIIPKTGAFIVRDQIDSVEGIEPAM